jgi:hypothetical protein
MLSSGAGTNNEAQQILESLRHLESQHASNPQAFDPNGDYLDLRDEAADIPLPEDSDEDLNDVEEPSNQIGATATAPPEDANMGNVDIQDPDTAAQGPDSTVQDTDMAVEDAPVQGPQNKPQDERMADATPVDPSIALQREKISAITPSWADEVEEDQELKHTAVTGRNLYGVLAGEIPVVKPKVMSTKFVKPVFVDSIQSIPSPKRTAKFYMDIAKYPEASTQPHSFGVYNTGKFGEKNTHAVFIIDGGKVATPDLRIDISLSTDPLKKLVTNDDASTITVSLVLPCGNVTTATGNQRAFLDNNFMFIRPLQDSMKDIPETGQEYFRLPSDKDANAFRARLFAMKWRIGGGAVLRNFGHPTVQRILRDGGGYHVEAAQNLRALLQLTTQGGLVTVLWSPPVSPEIRDIVWHLIASSGVSRTSSSIFIRTRMRMAGSPQTSSISPKSAEAFSIRKSLMTRTRFSLGILSIWSSHSKYNVIPDRCRGCRCP